jgi:hypothetical protein
MAGDTESRGLKAEPLNGQGKQAEDDEKAKDNDPAQHIVKGNMGTNITYDSNASDARLALPLRDNTAVSSRTCQMSNRNNRPVAERLSHHE